MTEHKSCHVCGDTLPPHPHHPEDCPEWDRWELHHRQQAGSWIWRVVALSCLGVWILIGWLTTSGILDAIDAWRAPWQ